MIDRHLHRRKEAELTPDVPLTHRQHADRVRRHLQALRGGNLFLSPEDADLLVLWLDDGIAVERILRGLEKAAEVRRRGRRRAPLAVRHAKRYLGVPRGKPSLPTPPPHTSAADHPLAPLVASLRTEVELGPSPASRAELETRLLALRDDAALAPATIAVMAEWFDDCWTGLHDASREHWMTLASSELQELAELLDPSQLEELVEEHARGLFRETHPQLCATTVLQLLR